MLSGTQFSPAELSSQSRAIIDNSAPGPKAHNKQTMKAAKEFESVFLTSMLENMFTGVETQEPFGGGHAEKVFRSLQIAEYAKEMSEKGGIGIADQVYRELMAIQEGVIK